jgi:hypothetical protein
MPTEFRTLVFTSGNDPSEHEAVILSKRYLERQTGLAGRDAYPKPTVAA